MVRASLVASAGAGKVTMKVVPVLLRVLDTQVLLEGTAYWTPTFLRWMCLLDTHISFYFCRNAQLFDIFSRLRTLMLAAWATHANLSSA
jgi:hypothetical protein